MPPGTACNKALQLTIIKITIRLYNCLKKIYRSHPEQILAKKNMGLVYLVTKNYDKALQQFDELAKMQDLYKNPGQFLKAVTLLERNEQGDKVQAKKLLEQLVNEKGEGSREAAKWLKDW